MTTPPTAPGTGRLARLLDALDERTGYRAARAAFLGRTQPGAPSLGRALGAATLALFAFLALTGVALALVYSPSSTDAWASVATLETATALGSLVRAAHYHATSVLFVVVALHLAHIVATAAYRRPNEVAWLVGVMTFLLLPAFAITGNALPNDQDGYWGFQVELGIIGDAPLVGGFAQAVLLGGDTFGNQTLTRLSTLHTLVLPGVFVALAALHVALARRRRPAEGQVATPVFPAQAAWNAGFALVVVGLAIGLGAALPARLDAPADPSSAFIARPEWYFMALNQLASLGALGTLVIPLVAVGLLFAAPFLDRRASGRPPLAVLAPLGLIGLGLGALTAKGLFADMNNTKLAEHEAATRAEAAETLAAFERSGVDAHGRVVLVAARALYVEAGCAACHDDPDKAAPRLAGWSSVERLSAFLADPDAPRFFGKGVLDGEMTAFGGTPEARTALATWLLAEGGVVRDAPAAVLAAGRKAFEDDDCTTCHNDPEVPLRDKGYDLRAVGPDLDGYGSAEWTRALIRDASHPRYFGDALSKGDLDDAMPAYPDLTDDDLSLLVQWLGAGAPGAK